MDFRTIREEAAHAGREPRVHGNGFIQLDLNEEGTKRLHIWDDQIPRQVVATPIHNHVFDMRSEVISGTLIHEELLPRYSAEGTHRIYHAEQQEGTQNTILVTDNDTVLLTLVQRLVLGAGSIYTFPAGKLHQTEHEGTTVTVMEKVTGPSDYGRPRVLVPVGSQPDNDFHRDAYDSDMLWAIIKAAVRDAGLALSA